MAGKKKKSENNSPRIQNRKARHDYHIHDSFECGIVLYGTEVKSIRNGKAAIADAYAKVDPETNELFIHNLDIATYENASVNQHEPRRTRKLLAHKKQIRDLLTATASKGNTLIPLTLYFNDRGIAKIELAVVSGKGHADKRQSLKAKEANRSIQQAMTRKRLG